MKKIYMQPQMAVVKIELHSAMLVASDPNITLGSGEIETIDTKDEGDWDLWDDWDE